MSSALFTLASRRILITGASSGIGRACAVLAAQLGADVVLTARRADELEATRKLVEEKFGSLEGLEVDFQTPKLPNAQTSKRCTILPGDLADSSFVRELVEKAGPCDGLVHAAGVSPLAPAGMISAEALAKAGRVNCGAFIELMNLFVKSKRVQRVQEVQAADNRQPATNNQQPTANNRFSAVVVSSVSAAAGWAGGTVYCATKGAVSAAVRALAVELAPQGIRVNAVCPSGIATPLYEAQAKMNPEAAAKHIAATQPLGLGQPEQVAAPVCFLLSEAASFITGVNLPVDGGFLAR